MNKDDIIRMAREVGMSPSADGMYWTATLGDLEKFAALVANNDMNKERVAETAKHRHEWVGLTEAEVELEADQVTDYYTFKWAVRWAEQRLKEKNCEVP